MDESLTSSREVPGSQVERAELADADALSALAALTFPLACPPELSYADIASFIEAGLSPAAFRDYLSDGDNLVLVTRDDQGDLLSYVLAIPGVVMDPGSAEELLGQYPLGISKFYAAPRAQGTGLARAMLAEVVRLAQVAGFDSLWLGTNLANGRARRFYEREGFVERGRRFFTVGEHRCEDAVYELMLHQRR